MVKEENIPDWKKRVPYEESEAAHHEKHHKEAMPVKEVPKERKVEPVPKERKVEPVPKERKVEPVRRVVEEKKVRREAAPERMGREKEAVCDACGRAHTGSDRCEVFDYGEQKFHICGECIPPVHANPADFLAGKKGTMTEQELWEHCKK